MTPHPKTSSPRHGYGAGNEGAQAVSTVPITLLWFELTKPDAAGLRRIQKGARVGGQHIGRDIKDAVLEFW